MRGPSKAARAPYGGEPDGDPGSVRRGSTTVPRFGVAPVRKRIGVAPVRKRIKPRVK